MPPPHSSLRSLSKSRCLVLNILSSCFTGPNTPPPRDDHMIYEAQAQDQRHEPTIDRRRSPGPATDSELSARRERPSRFGPGPVPATPGGTNGLPTKPMAAQDDRLRGSRRERQNTDRIDQHRRFDDSTHVLPASASRSPVNTVNNIDRSWVPANQVDQERTSPFESENSNLPREELCYAIVRCSDAFRLARKRQPLPPQEAEFRGLGRSKPGIYPEPSGPFRGEDIRSPTMSSHIREKVPEVPPSRPYPTRDEAREGQFNHPPSGRSNMPGDYVREQGRERGRSRQHFKDPGDTEGNFDVMGDHPPMQELRGSYPDRQHEPPLKPRAMQNPPVPSAGVYPSPSLSISAPVGGDRYRGRPSPPHLVIPNNRRDADMQTSSNWQQERREEWRPPLDPAVSLLLFIDSVFVYSATSPLMNPVEDKHLLQVQIAYQLVRGGRAS